MSIVVDMINNSRDDLRGRKAAALALAAAAPDMTYPALSAFIRQWVPQGRDEGTSAHRSQAGQAPVGSSSSAAMWDDAVAKVNQEFGAENIYARRKAEREDRGFEF